MTAACRTGWTPLVVLAVVLGGPMRPACAGTDPPMTEAGFSASLGALAARLEGAGPDEAAAVATALPDAWAVATADGVVAVPTAPIRNPLRSVTSATWPANRAAAMAAIEAMRGATTPRAGSPIAGAAPRLAAILARPEFRPRAGDSWKRALAERIRTWLRDQLRRLGLPPTLAPTLARGVIVVLIVAALVVLARRLLRARRDGPTGLAIEPHHRQRASADWLVQLAAALRTGNTREAWRAAYHAVVARFGEQGVWTVDEARTPREYQRLLAGADPRRLAFAALARDFERAWYGDAAPETRRLAEQLEGCGCAMPATPRT